MIAIISSVVLCVACNSKVSRINIHGTYKGTGVMSYEAVVENGTITIYSNSFFVVWHMQCKRDEQ